VLAHQTWHSYGLHAPRRSEIPACSRLPGERGAHVSEPVPDLTDLGCELGL